MFEVGDLVFAKLKGHRHPHWPAVVIEVFKLGNQSLSVKSRTSFFGNHSLNIKFKTGTPIQSDKKRKVKDEAPRDKFNVKFFGTNQTAIVAADSVVLYNDDSAERFNTAKNRKFRFFKDALEKIAEMKSKTELKSSQHSSRITRSAVKNMVNRKPDIGPLIQKTEEGEHKVMSNMEEQDGKQLMTNQLHIQESSIPVAKSLEEFDKTPASDHLILPQKSFKIANLPSPSDTLQSKSSLDHPKDHRKRAHSSSSSLSIPMDILLSSPTRDTQSDPVANLFNHQDITLSSLANHCDQEDISVSAPVTNHRDITLSSPVANHCDQEDISVFAPVTNHRDITLSSPVANHRDQEDISVFAPVANHRDQEDISVLAPVTNHRDITFSSPVANHCDQEDISVLVPVSNHRDITLSSPVDNHCDQEDISVFTPVTDHRDIEDISVFAPVTDHRDIEDISVLDPVTNHQDIALSSPVANHCDQEDISVFTPVTDHRDISVFDPVTNHQDIALSSHLANHRDQEDITVLNPVTNNQDIILSFPAVNHHNYEDIAVSTPLLNHPDLQDFHLTNQRDISISSPLKILHNHKDLQDTPVPTPVVNHHNQQDISVSSPLKILHNHEDLQDTSVSTPVVNHHNQQDISVSSPISDHRDIAVSITEVNHPRSLHPLVIVSSRHSHDPQEQLNSSRSCSSVPEVNDEAFLHLNSQSCSFLPLMHDEVYSHPIVLSPNHSYDYNNEEQHKSPICTSFPRVNDESHLESSSSSNLNDFPPKLFLRGDEHKTSNDTKVHRIKSSEWSPIRKKRKLTIESSNASNGLSSSWKLDMNTTSVQDNLDESSSSWVEETLEESFSCEENPCELSWVEPSLPEDLDDCTSVTCVDINKLMVGQNNFNQLDDSNDIKIEVLVSDLKFSDSDDIEPRNSDFNILSEQKLREPEEQNSNCNFLTEEKLPYLDPQYFISNLLTGLIGYIIDAFFDDDFEAYCCDELFSVAQLEEHIKKFHRDTPADVTIKTCEW